MFTEKTLIMLLGTIACHLFSTIHLLEGVKYHGTSDAAPS